MYIDRSTVLKLCRRKSSGRLNVPTIPLPTPSTDLDPIPNKLVNPTSKAEQPTTLPLVLTSLTLNNVSASQEKYGVIRPITISSQHDHTSCSALVDTGSPVTLLSEKIQGQHNLPATSLKSNYNLIRSTGETLTSLGTVQVDIFLDRKVWPTLVIVVSSLAHPLILGLNFLKLTKSKVDFETNTVEVGSQIYPADTHCIIISTSAIIIPTSDVYRPCQLLLNKKACWVVIFMLITVIFLTAVASHTKATVTSHPTVTSSLPLESRASLLFHLNAILPGRNYWRTAPPSVLLLSCYLLNPRRIVDYTSLTGHSHHS